MKIRSFENYLIALQYAKSTTQEHLRNVNEFMKWCLKVNIACQKADYNDLMDFISYLNNKVEKSTVKLRLSSVNIFFDFLFKTGKIKCNPVSKIKLEGRKNKALSHLLSQAELNELFDFFYLCDAKQLLTDQMGHKKHCLILGMVLFQGLTATEFKRLRVTDVYLSEGALHVPESNISKSRIIPLQSIQILPLMNYIQNKKGEYLFDGDIHNLLYFITKKIKKCCDKKYSIQHLRSSRIVLWIKEYGLRKAQYYSGIKYISSMEKYRLCDLETLQKEVELFNPLA